MQSCIEKEKIKKAIRLFKEDCQYGIGSLLLRDWPAPVSAEINKHALDSQLIECFTSSAILIWDILRHYPELSDLLRCPFCLDSGLVCSLRRSGMYADNTWSQAAYHPRIIYDCSDSLVLVSHIYICPNNHQIPAHHPSVVSAIPSSTNKIGMDTAYIRCRHLQGFGLEEVEVQKDGNCFFTTVAFQLSNLFSSISIEENIISHLRTIGLTRDMDLQQLSQLLRLLLVQEWRSDRSQEYGRFIPEI
ncbi:uncharacterized protein LOC114538403 [Dendronephthya gigantea]|uniref:uncharacterized protein LOC114538403 n=1 Tax=Dendronephthya gigantea TaxID=151771 RepID=UPI00106C5A51|nr:uncharacterized protein LOC114538403 [Dendronephthya gigantea]